MPRRGAATTKLAKYRSMRDFARTPEPSGDARRAQGQGFVIQKHAARRLHYDFRLEHDGVLWSWSVPKGPSLSPKERRLAVRTEDHPVEYANFEGIIPKGQYGGGTVVVWDRGTWQPETDASEAMKRGRLTFTLQGEKLHGRWHLVRTKGDGRTENWLLFKSRDDAATERGEIVEAQPESVITGRTIEEVAEASDRVWQSRPQAPTVQQKRAARIARAKREQPPAGEELPELLAKLPLGFKLTNLDKILYPDEGITKGQLIAYMAVVADHMLPLVANRPLTLVRCPEGRGPGGKFVVAPRSSGARGRNVPCFFQKHILAGSPSAIHPLPLTEVDGEVVNYMTIRDMPGLVALAQLGTLEVHTWGSHADKPEKPDLMVFDLDPDEGLEWNHVALAAFAMRRRLHELGFTSFVKTTGGKGLHVVAPIRRGPDWDDFKAFTKAVVETMEREEPKLYTSNMGKVHRRGKIFLDYLRNGRNATFIAPYSPRARDGAPVAVPITWEELAKGIDPAAFTMATVPRRLAKLARDPWAAIADAASTITAATWKAVGGKP
jgi:bifunctional non-homologous end joining protein LigD